MYGMHRRSRFIQRYTDLANPTPQPAPGAAAPDGRHGGKGEPACLVRCVARRRR